MAKGRLIAVREFALPVPRRGSIEALSGFGPLLEHGIEAHCRVQAMRRELDPGYQPEVAIAHAFVTGQYSFRVSGRIDGFSPGPSPFVEEIKSAFDIDGLERRLEEQPDHPYLLQLKTYAYMLHLRDGVAPRCQMTLVSLRTQKITAEIEVAYDRATYEAWLALRLKELVAEEKLCAALRRRRLGLGESLRFPFPEARPGQLELTAKLSAILGESGEPVRALVQAPTGLGKTAGILHPTLVEALKRGSPVVYVTPKNSQQGAAEDTAKRLKAENPKLKAITLVAKHRICMQDEPTCDPLRCEFAKDYYENVATKDLAQKLVKQGLVTERTLKNFAEKHRVCPYELSLDAAPYFDVVVGDYNYVITPHGLPTRMASTLRGKGSKTSLIIDEAHNLPSRAADNLSADLSERALVSLATRLGAKDEALWADGKRLAEDVRGAVVKIGSRLSPGQSSARVVPEPGVFSGFVDEAKQLSGRYLASMVEITARDPLIELIRLVDGFSQALKMADDAFVIIFDRSTDDQALKVVCLDASAMLRESFAEFTKIVGFSATLKPFDYYARLSGMDGQQLVTAEFTSPFPTENRKLLVIPQVSTKYRERHKHIDRIADAVSRIVQVHPGNYAVFFPSYQFLGEVARGLAPAGFEVIRQAPEMTRRQTNALLERLACKGEPVLLLAVQGGGLSEGLDFAGDLLVGAIIVGPALPTMGPAREAMKEYCEKHYGKGDDYAYTVPAMTRVIQAAGRVIRSEKDRGLIVLMDERFMQPRYTSLMPDDWYKDSVSELVSRRILADVRSFWEVEP